MANDSAREGLTLAVLGSWQATLDGQLLPRLPTVRAQALLTYLAIEGAMGERSQRRETLMELFWPGMPPSSGRKNLRQTLYYVRQGISDRMGDGGAEIPFLFADRYRVEINPDFPLWLDAAEFLHLLDGPEGDWPEALALYQGDFLADFFLDDSGEFEAWVLARRGYLQRRVLDALSTLTDEAIGRRAYAQARHYAERQLTLDELREGAHRQMMELLALDGRRQEALAQFERCRRLLAEELSMAPSARTMAIYERIKSGEVDSDAPPVQVASGYRLKEKIGAGAYGEVHRAIQPAVNREVAIKVIRRQYADDPAFIRRFETEAQTVAHLEHPHIVPLYDYWRDPEGAYLVMRYLRGGDLRSVLQAGPVVPTSALELVRQITSALNAAHRQGIVHRDLKPANILFDEEGNAYLSDFGIAKILDTRGEDVAGSIASTPEYISPEQILNQPLSTASDIYSLGILLYVILTGHKPFAGVHTANLIHQHLHVAVPSVSDAGADLPPQVDAVIQRATEKRPGERYASALELAEAFEAALRGQDSAQAPAFRPPVDVPNPYKGLRAFQEADAEDFYGRQALIEQLVARLASSPFLAVVGPSGSGKSSAVKAGLVPALRRGALPGSEKWFVAEMVPGVYPLEELEKALWPVAVDPPPSLVEPMSRDEKGLLRTVRRILPDEEGATLLLIIDQFEELFTLVDDERRRDHFIDSLLAALAEPNSPLRVVVTLRADFYDRPLQRQELGRWLKENTEVILPLSAEELNAAIGGPARRAGVALQDGLAPAIAAGVQDEPGALPLLQYALTELFERRQDGQMTLAAYDDIDRVTGALTRRAEDLFAGLDKAGQVATRQIFLRLVTLGEGTEDTRRRVLRSELEAVSTAGGRSETTEPVQATESTIENVLDLFGRYRLLTFDRDPVTRGPTVEIAHEALLREWPRLRGWLDESRYDVRLQRLLANAAAEWRASGQEEGYLLHGARLSQFESWAAESDLALTGEEQGFLDASLVARQKRQEAEEAQLAREAALEARSRNRLRYLVGVLAAATIVAVILVIFAFTQQRTAQQERDNAQAEAEARATQQAIAEQERAEAERQAQLAFSRELAAAAQNDLDVDPERSILLALEALAAAHTIQAENVLHEAIQHSRVRQTFNVGSDLWDIAMSPDGRYVATGDQDGVATIWDVATGEAITTLVGHAASIRGVAYNNDGDLLATAGDDNARVWDPTTGQELFAMNSTQGAFGVDFSPDGRLLATSNYDNTVKLWDVEASLTAGSGQEVHNLSGHTDWLWNVNFSADGSRVATASSDGTAIIWSTSSGEETLNLQVWENPEEGGTVESAIFSTDGERIVTVGGTLGESELTIWDAATGERLYGLDGHSGIIMNAKLSPDGSLLATVGVDGTAKLWDFAGGNRQPLFTLSGHTNWIPDAAFSPDGKFLVTASRDGTARLWDISIAGNQELLNYAGHSDWLRSISFSPDESWLATAGNDGTAQIWHGNSGETLLTLAEHDATINAVTFSPDGARLATVSEDNTARLWDTMTGEQLHLLDGHSEKKYHEGGEPEGVMDVAFSPDGARLATAAMDGQIKVWDVGTGEELLSLSGHPEERGIYSVAFSRDGALLASGTDQPSVVKVWDAVTGRELLNLPGYEDSRIYGIDFSPDGSRLAITNNTGQLTIWSLPELNGEQSEQTPEELLSNPAAHSTGLGNVMFSSDGTRLVTASFDQTAKVWDVESGQPLLTLNHPDGLWDARFSPDGTRLATAGLDGVARLFTIDLDELVELARTRVTRSLTTAECQQFLHLDACPEGE